MDSNAECQFAVLSDTECVEYAAECIAEDVPIPRAVKERLQDLGIYNLIMESVEHV